MRGIAMLVDFVLVMLIVLVVGGCAASKPTVHVIETQRLQLVEVDMTYLKDCELVNPPDRSLSHSFGADEREDQLTRLLLQQYTYTQVCTQDKRSLRALLERQRQIVQQHNTDEAQRVTALKHQLESQP